MPISRRRKKKGKKVKGHGAQIKVDPNKESAVSLQDLINVVAYQEYVKDGTIVPDDVVVNMADNIPVNVVNPDGTKTQVGTASREHDDQVSIDITDPEVQKMIQMPVQSGDYSIDKEHDE